MLQTQTGEAYHYRYHSTVLPTAAITQDSSLSLVLSVLDSHLPLSSYNWTSLLSGATVHQKSVPHLISAAGPLHSYPLNMRRGWARNIVKELRCQSVYSGVSCIFVVSQTLLSSPISLSSRLPSPLHSAIPAVSLCPPDSLCSVEAPLTIIQSEGELCDSCSSLGRPSSSCQLYQVSLNTDCTVCCLRQIYKVPLEEKKC